MCFRWNMKRHFRIAVGQVDYVERPGLQNLASGSVRGFWHLVTYRWLLYRRSPVVQLHAVYHGAHLGLDLDVENKSRADWSSPQYPHSAEERTKTENKLTSVRFVY